MSTRSYEERLEDLKRRQNQLKEQEKDLRKRVATEERKKKNEKINRNWRYRSERVGTTFGR